MPFKCRFCGQTVKSAWSCNQPGCQKSAGSVKFETVPEPTVTPSTTPPTPQSTPKTLNPQTLGSLVSKHPRANVNVNVAPTTNPTIQTNPTTSQPKTTSNPTPTQSSQTDSKDQKRKLIEQIKEMLLELEKSPGSVDTADYTQRVRSAAIEPGTLALERIRNAMQEKRDETRLLIKELLNVLKELKQVAPSRFVEFAGRAKSSMDNSGRTLLISQVKEVIANAKQPQPTTTSQPTTTTSTTTSRPKPSLTEAISQISTLGPAELRKKSIGEKVDLLTPIVDGIKSNKNAINQIETQLQTATGVTKKNLEERLDRLKQERDSNQLVCNKLYKVTVLDEQFKNNDIQQRQTYLTALANNSELQSASIPDNWNAMTNGDKKDLMQFALNEQYSVLAPGATPPTIELKYWPDDEPDQEKVQQAEDNKTLPQGYYDANVHKIIFWVYKKDGDATEEKGPLKDFKEAIDTAIHETSHAYQNELVKQLDEVESGRKTPPPPKPWEIDQAKLFRLNQNAYEDGGLDRDAYLKEPLELHAWLAGGTAAMLFDYDAQVMDLQHKLNKVAGWFPDKKGMLLKLASDVKGKSAKLAEKGPEVLKLLEIADRLSKDIPNVRKQPEAEYRQQKVVIEKLWDEFNKIKLYDPVYSRYRELHGEYVTLHNNWSQNLVQGPLSALELDITSLVNLTGKVERLLVLGKAFATCKASIGKMVDAINGVKSDKFTKLHWTEYQSLNELYENLKTRNEQLAEASDVNRLQSLNSEILQATNRANSLPR